MFNPQSPVPLGKSPNTGDLEGLFIIKVCGMRDASNIRAVEQEVSPDCMGFIFYPKSPRYVAAPPDYLPTACDRVGVFVNAELNFILDRVCDYGLHAIQLHGEESPEYIRRLRCRIPDRMMIIKALSVGGPDSGEVETLTAPYLSCVDFFLFDTPSAGYGGSGKAFDWSALQSYRGSVPFILSGGIGPGSLEELRAFRHPRCVGIDLNSRFETEPGIKDVALLRDFIHSYCQIVK